MASTPDSGGIASEPQKEETPNQRQARLRRERRQAKIVAEGSSRLAAITNISGRGGPEPASSQTNTAEQISQPTSTDAPDPEESDISQHHYQPRLTPRPPPPQPDSGWHTPQPGMQQQQQQQAPSGSDDPMLRMLQQMMGGDPNADPTADLPPALRNLFRAAQQDEKQEQPQHSSSTTNVWRIVHALVSVALAAYVVLTSGFTGSRAARENLGMVTAGGHDHVARRLFVYFAAVEVALQSGRYLLERGQLPRSGVIGALSRMLPEPYAGYVRIAGRYSVIYSTIVSDAMVIVFVLGAVAWWNGVAEI